MFDLPDSAILFADSARGVYIPQHFAESVNRANVTGVSDEDFAILASDPHETEWLWETWDSVLNNARLHDPSTGITYCLYQDGDLWLVPEDWQPED